MQSDFRIVFSSKFFFPIILISGLLRITFQYVFLPSIPSSFGPDEGTYAALAKYVEEGLPVQEFPGYGPSLYNTSRSFILPSSLLIRLGLDELVAVRATSSLYGLLSTIVLGLCFAAFLRVRFPLARDYSAHLGLRFTLLVLIFSFVPSNFLWSVLGLRESASQFWLMTTAYLCIVLIATKQMVCPHYVLGGSVCLVLAFGARRETALVFSLILLLLSAFLFLKLRNISVSLVVALGFIGGQFFTTTPTVEVKESLSAVKLSPGESKSPAPTQSGESKSPAPTQSGESKSPAPTQSGESKSRAPTQSGESKSPAPTRLSEVLNRNCTFENQVFDYQNETYKCKKKIKYDVLERNAVETVKNQVLTTQILEYKREVNSLEAQSALPVKACEFSIHPLVDKLLCNLSELPYRLPTFLFRPFPLVDSGSTFLQIAGIENLFWMVLVFMGMRTLFFPQISQQVRIATMGLAAYVLVFSTAAALYEGNLGTAFRHKSAILWPLILILLFSFNPKGVKGSQLSLNSNWATTKREKPREPL
jgi:hypothetical protein